MKKNNQPATFQNKFYWTYLLGFFIILTLPLWAFPPLFFPPEWGKSIAFRMVLSIILLLFIWQITSKNQFWRSLIEKYNSQKKTLLILAALFLTLFLSTLFSSDILFSIFASPHRSGGFADFAFYILFSVILFLMVKNNNWKKLWDFLFLIGDLVVAFAIIQYFDLLPKFLIPYEGRPPSTLSSPMLLAIFFILLIFPVLSSIIEEKSRKKFFYWISFLLFAFGIFISGSRAAYLGLVIGGFYFLFFYPKKFRRIKITTSIILLLIISAVVCINIFPSSLNFIKNNPKLSLILRQRLSIQAAVQDLAGTRFSAWQIFLKAVAHKPLLGWGPENQQIGFDKYYYYKPSLAALSNWWDRAHNIFLDLAVSYGIPFLIIFLLLFGLLFWKLQKNKKANKENKISSHAIQSLFLSYFITLSFGFDSVTTYIILFFIIGYSLYLTEEPQKTTTFANAGKVSLKWLSVCKKRKFIAFFLFIILFVFLWKYNVKPLIINAEINKAEDLECDKKLSAFEKIFNQKSFLDSFLRLKYVSNVKGCENYIKNNEIEYIKKSLDALKYSAKVQPNYTRTWISLGQFNTTLAAAQTDPEIKNALLKESEDYFKKAQELSPERQEVLIGLTETYFVARDYEKMKEKSEECRALNAGNAQCYWYLGLSEILLNNEKKGEQDIETAKEKGYSYDNQASYSQLAIAYTVNKNYKKLIPIYNSLLVFDEKNIQYHATLAFIYKEIGDYKKAREEALKIIEISPEAKDDVNAFLNTLP